MDDYVDSYEPLIVKKSSPSEIEVIDDFNYNSLKRGNFATDYTQFHQKNYVQLPAGLVRPKKVSKMKFTFTPAKTFEEEDEESQEISKESPPGSQSISNESRLGHRSNSQKLPSESESEMEFSSDSSLLSSSASSSQNSSNDGIVIANMGAK